MTIGIDELESKLHGDDAFAGRPDLATIRAAGTRRRRTRRLAVAGAGVATAAVVAGAAFGGSGLLDRATDSDQKPAPADHQSAEPSELSPLAKRALEEVPGARQVSDWQVVIPGPARPPASKNALMMFGEELGPERFAGPRVPMGRWWSGVTAFPKQTFPAWLWDGVEDWEKANGEPDGSYSVGSTDMGVIVDTGQAELACMNPWDWDKGKELPGRCYPAMIGELGGRHFYLWGMGTDDFLKPGAPMELFSSEDYSDGRERLIWRGGVAGTDVAGVEFEMPDGKVVDGTVAAGTMVPRATMFWATLDGEPATVRTYDEAGNVLETHEVQDCSGGVDCEVR